MHIVIFITWHRFEIKSHDSITFCRSLVTDYSLLMLLKFEFKFSLALLAISMLRALKKKSHALSMEIMVNNELYIKLQ